MRQPNEGLLPHRHCYPRMEAGTLHSAAGGSHALPGVRSGDPHAARLLVVLQGVSSDLQSVLFSPWRMTIFRLKCWECQEVGRIGKLVVQTEVAKAFIERHLETCTKIGHPPDFRIKCERCKNPDEIGHDQIHTEAAKSYLELHLLECYPYRTRSGG